LGGLHKEGGSKMPRVPIEEVFVPHTTTQVVVNSLGNITQYFITPNEGFVLHFNRNDEVQYNEDYTEVVSRTERYSTGGGSVSINYDFSVVVPDTYTYTDKNGNTVNVPIERIGAEELYTLPIDIVQSSQF
jgi:hypothetical protein